MLKSGLQFFVSITTFALLVAALVIFSKEGETYVGPELLWKSESWNFWPK